MIIAGSFKTFHKFVIFDTIFATSKRCKTHTLQTSKVIEIQNGDQIQIRLVELVLGKIVLSKTNFGISRKLNLCMSKSQICVLLVSVPTSSPGTPYYSLEISSTSQLKCSQRPEGNLYEYCALAQEICGLWHDFAGSYGSEGVFLVRCQIFRLGHV